MKHTDSNVIDQAVKTIRHLLSTVILRGTNTTKLSDLQLQLVVSLREAVEGRDVESSVFVEDELLALGSCVGRLERLYTACDLSEQLDDTEDGKQTSAWEIVDSLAERGRLGYKDEDAVSPCALLPRPGTDAATTDDPTRSQRLGRALDVVDAEDRSQGPGGRPRRP